jgi:hypothetical protein
MLIERTGTDTKSAKPSQHPQAASCTSIVPLTPLKANTPLQSQQRAADSARWIRIRLIPVNCSHEGVSIGLHERSPTRIYLQVIRSPDPLHPLETKSNRVRLFVPKSLSK